MIEEAGKLVAYGADVIALTCNTAHYFYEELQDSVTVPVLNIGRLAVEKLSSNKVRKVGLMATSGTVECGIYQTACSEKNIECLVPDADEQHKVMDVIYRDIKSGRRADMTEFRMVSESLFSRGAEMIVLGCTELSLVKKQEHLDDRFIDPLEILAAVSIEACGYKVRERNE